MSIKIEAKIDTTIPEVSYPCFKKSNNNGLVVLFFSEFSGIVVSKGNLINSVGEFSEDWSPTNFSKPLQNCSVTISSEP
jgi:hypothetical protein